MTLDRKTLMQRLKAARDEGRAAVKAIVFPLPDLRGPSGNAFSLLGQAHALIKNAGLSPLVYDAFHKEATSDDYDHLLRTLQEWFEVTVANVQYEPLGETDILSLRPDPNKSYDDWAPYEGEKQSEDAVLDQHLTDLAEKSEKEAKMAELQDRINREVRSELGLSDDDVVIVQVKKAKP